MAFSWKIICFNSMVDIVEFPSKVFVPTDTATYNV